MLGDEETRDRILRAIGPMKKPARPRGGRAGALLLVAAIGVAAIGLSMVGRRMQKPPEPGPGEIVVRIGRGATRAGAPVRRRERVTDGRIEIAEGGRLEASVRGAVVSVAGPAAIGPRSDGVIVFAGAATVDGEAVVEAAECEATVSGRAHVARFATHARVDVERGTAQAGANAAACDIHGP